VESSGRNKNDIICLLDDKFLLANFLSIIKIITKKRYIGYILIFLFESYC